MSSSSSYSYADSALGVAGAGSGGAAKLPRLTSTSYAKWRPDAENSFKRYGMKDSDYKKEIKDYQVVKSYADSLDEQETTAATDYILAKLSGSARAQQASASGGSSASLASATSPVTATKKEAKPSVAAVPTAGDDEEKAHNKMIRGVIERSNRVYALLYESLSDDIRVLVNNNSAIVDGYGYSLWKWLELKYQSTEGDSVGKLWSDFTTAMQREDEDWEKHKAKVDAMVRLLAAAKQTVPPALYATILLDRLVPKYNGIKMAIDSTKELGKDRENIEWTVVTKFIQAQERTIERQSDPSMGGTSAREAQAMSAARLGASAAPNEVSRFPSRTAAIHGRDRDVDLPFKGQDCCWCCGMKNHSFRRCHRWLGTDSEHAKERLPDRDDDDTEQRSPSVSPRRSSSPHSEAKEAGAYSAISRQNKYSALSYCDQEVQQCHDRRGGPGLEAQESKRMDPQRMHSCMASVRSCSTAASKKCKPVPIRRAALQPGSQNIGATVAAAASAPSRKLGRPDYAGGQATRRRASAAPEQDNDQQLPVCQLPGLPSKPRSRFDGCESRAEGGLTSSPEYVVERIVKHRVRSGRTEYAVKWIGYRVEQSTWLTKGQLEEEGGATCVDAYESARGTEELATNYQKQVQIEPGTIQPACLQCSRSQLMRSDLQL